jgi:hypothetical protein
MEPVPGGPARLDDSGKQRLAAEIRSAARCSELLKWMGVRITFQRDVEGKTLDIEARSPSGRLLCPLTPHDLFDLIARDAEDLEAWAAAIGSPEKDRAVAT